MRRISCLVALLAMLSCGGSSQVAQPSPTPVISSQSKAADLRVHMNVLFSEHVYLVAKAGGAAAGARTDEYTAYATQITKNSDDIQSLISAAAGASSTNVFGRIWNQYLGLVAAYTVGVVSHDDAKTAIATSGLTDQFTPALAGYLTTSQGAIQTVQQFVGAMRMILDDEAAASWPKVFVDIATAVQSASQIGDDLGAQFIRAYPDRFPGASAGKVFGLRLALNLDLQQLSYLGTMTTAATIGARTDEAAGATEATSTQVRSLTTDLTSSKSETWKAWTTDLTSYATKVQVGDLKQAQDQIANDGRALGALYLDVDPAHAVNDAVNTQTQAAVAVVDAQRSKDVNAAAAKDRAAAAAMGAVADAVAYFAVKADPGPYKT